MSQAFSFSRREIAKQKTRLLLQTGFKWRPLGLSSLPPANPTKPFCATSRNTAFGFALYSASFAYALSRVRSSILS